MPCGTRIEQKPLFLKLFGAPGISRQNPGISAKKFGSPGLRRTYQTFWPPPLYVEDPPPHPKISIPKSLGLGFFFSLNVNRFYWGGDGLQFVEVDLQRQQRIAAAQVLDKVALQAAICRLIVVDYWSVFDPMIHSHLINRMP